MIRLAATTLCLLAASSAQATVLRISAEPPLSVERLADAIRTYVDGTEVDVSPVRRVERQDGGFTAPGVVEIELRAQGAGADDAELVLLDGQETVLSRLPGALRVEDLYRAAALKVQSLLQRRTVPVSPGPASIVEGAGTAKHPGADRFLLGAGLAVLVPSAGPAREGVSLAAGLRFARRWHLSLGAYLEPQQSTRVGDIDVSAWELPLLLGLGCDWHESSWVGWLDLVGHLAVRRVSAEAAEVVSNSGVALSPRAGGAMGGGVVVGQGLRLEVQVSLLAVLADTRYRVDGQVVWPAAGALGVIELGLAYGGH